MLDAIALGGAAAAGLSLTGEWAGCICVFTQVTTTRLALYKLALYKFAVLYLVSSIKVGSVQVCFLIEL